MPKQHVVKEGECFSSIAFDHGFYAETIWNHPANAKLKRKRENMNVLNPGDVVFVPDLRPKIEKRPTGAQHRFRKRGVPAELRLVILDGDEPFADQPFTIVIDDVKKTAGKTDGQGKIVIPIMPDARGAHLTVGRGEDVREYDLELGLLNPVEGIKGVQSRLNNLGFDCRGEEGQEGPKTEAALTAFQGKHGLAETGKIDDATRRKLRDLHDAG